MDEELEALVARTTQEAERAEQALVARRRAVLDAAEPLQALRRSNDALEVQVEAANAELDRAQRAIEVDPNEAALRRAVRREYATVAVCAVSATAGAWGAVGLLYDSSVQLGLLGLFVLLAGTFQVWTEE